VSCEKRLRLSWKLDECKPLLLGVDTTAIVLTFTDKFPDVFPPIVVVLKLLCAQWGLDRPFNGGLGSFKLYCLVAGAYTPPLFSSTSALCMG